MKKVKIVFAVLIILSLLIAICACTANDNYYLRVDEYWVLTSEKPTDGDYYAFNSKDIDKVIEKIVIKETAKQIYIYNIEESSIRLIYTEQPQYLKYEVRYYSVTINSSTYNVGVHIDTNKTITLIDVE